MMNVKEKILEIISEISEVENIKEKLIEQDDLAISNLNSISFIKFVVAIEEEYNIEFDDDRLIGVGSNKFSELCDYVERKLDKVE